MEAQIYSPSWRSKPNGEWKTLARATVRSLWRDGYSVPEIIKKTGLPRTNIRRWIHAETSRTTRKGKATKPRLMSRRQIRQIIRYIAKN